MALDLADDITRGSWPDRHALIFGTGAYAGATMAALIVLPAMGLPVTLVALLISVEPLIDMGRTALNVNGSMTAGTITSQLLGQTDRAVMASEDEGSLQNA